MMFQVVHNYVMYVAASTTYGTTYITFDTQVFLVCRLALAVLRRYTLTFHVPWLHHEILFLNLHATISHICNYTLYVAYRISYKDGTYFVQ